MTFALNFQIDFYGPALFELCPFKCSSLCSTVSFSPITTFHTEPAPRVGGVRVGACVFLGVARLVLLVVVFVQVQVLGDHQGHVLKMELVFRLGGNTMTTVGVCVAVCVLH